MITEEGRRERKGSQQAIHKFFHVNRVAPIFADFPFLHLAFCFLFLSFLFGFCLFLLSFFFGNFFYECVERCRRALLKSWRKGRSYCFYAFAEVRLAR